MILGADLIGFSFRKIASLLERGFRSVGYRDVKILNMWNPLSYARDFKIILLGDTILMTKAGFLERARVMADKIVFWGDTPLSLEHLDAKKLDDACVYTTLPHQIKLYAEHGVKVYGYIPRPVDVDTAVAVRNEDCRDLHSKYGEYIITVGSDQIIYPPKIPRKGMDMYDLLCEKLKNVRCIAVSNWRFKNVISIKSGSLPEKDLLKLIKCSKLFVWTSRAEGFGMPPVEAMAVGTPVVSSDAPFNEHIIGVKFSYDTIEKVFMPELNMYYYAYDYSPLALREAVVYALSMSEDERSEIVSQGIELAKYYHPMRISIWLGDT